MGGYAKTVQTNGEEFEISCNYVGGWRRLCRGPHSDNMYMDQTRKTIGPRHKRDAAPRNPVTAEESLAADRWWREKVDEEGES